MSRRNTLPERFWAKVDRRGPNECWGWKATVNNHGYGKLYVSEYRGPREAHRVSWTLHFGAVPQGLCVLHHCDNPPCTNPAHLYVGTYGDNGRDVRVRGRAYKAYGVENRTSRMNDEMVRELRKRWPGPTSLVALAREFGVSQSTIYAACIRRTWKHVP